VAVLTAKPLTARPLTAVALMARAVGEAVARFSISDLFANGEVGAAIGYSDSRLLFQDVNGTEPATEVGDPYGLALSTAQGLRPTGDALGPELVTNGTFDDGLTGWSAASDAVLSVSDNQLNIAVTGGDDFGVAHQTISTSANERYAVQVDASEVSDQYRVRVNDGDTVGLGLLNGALISSTGRATFYFTAESSESNVSINTVGADSNTRIRIVSIRRVVPISERFAGLGDEGWIHADVVTSGDSEIISNNVYRVYSSDGSLSTVNETNTPGTTGDYVLVSFTIDSIATVGAGIRLGNAGPIFTTTGRHEVVYQKEGVSVLFKRQAGITDFQISGVAVKLLPGPHATQSTDTARPWRGRRPAGGVRNLLPQSTSFGDLVFTAQNGATIDGNTVSYPSTPSNAEIAVNVGVAEIGTYVFSVEARLVSGSGNLSFDFSGPSPAENSPTLTSDFVRYSFVITFDEVPAATLLYIKRGNAAAKEVEFRNPQWELASTATPYQRVAAPYDITEEGVASRFYAWDDEVDDDMTIVLPDLGTDATRVTVDRDGNVTYLENQTISGSVSVPLNSQAVIYLDRTPTADEKTGIEGLF
jgi:hypothetical protein